MAITAEDIQREKDKVKEAAKVKLKELNKKLSAIERRSSSKARNADTHVKASYGGEILRTLFDETSDKYEVAYLKKIIARADSAITPEGEGRALYRTHKAKLGLE